MKLISRLLFLLIILPLLLSCHNNRLKTDEKKLGQEIKKQESEKLAVEIDASETHNHNTGSFRKKEIRSVDKERPPVKIDILGTPFLTKEIKLSDVASSIRYVKLQTPTDTTLLYDHFYYRPDIDSYIRSDGEQIIFQGIFGLTRFNMNGEYLETIWKNNSGIKFHGSKMVSYGGDDFFGVLPHIPVSISGGYLYTNFMNGPGQSGQVMKYKLNSDNTLTSLERSEIQKFKHFPGDTVLELKKFGVQSFEQIQGIGPDTWAGLHDKYVAGTSGVLIVTYNNQGDTLCKFSDFERIVNFPSTQVRTAVELASYTFNGHLTIKQEYNDTVFRLIPPNRLLPVYIIKFGGLELSYMDGLNPSFDLSGKYMLKSLFETKDFLYIRYTQNYDSPITRKKNAVKFYNALFSKKENKLYHQPGYSTVPEGMMNDLDGGISFWPDFITPRGEMMKLQSGQVLKDYVNSDRFRKSSISEENRKKQISMAEGLKPTDMVVIIVK